MRRWIMVGICLALITISIMFAGCGQRESSNIESTQAEKEVKGQDRSPVTAQSKGEKAEGEAQAVATPVKVKLAVTSPILEYLTFLLAQDRGFFRDEGLDVEVNYIKTNMAMPAMLTGEIEYMGMTSGIPTAVIRGMPLKVVMGTLRSLMFSFVARPEIKTAADLSGKTVGVMDLAGANFVSAEAAIKHLGLMPKDVTIIRIGQTNERVAALESKAIFASPMSPPQYFDLLDKGYNELVFTGDILQMPYVGLGTTNKNIQENRALVKKAIRALLKTYDYMARNKNETVAFIGKQYKVNSQHAQKAYDVYLRLLLMDGRVSVEGQQANINQSKLETASDKELPLEQVYDFSILEEVHKEVANK